jgi:nicotinate phosphoribosyltransferase
MEHSPEKPRPSVNELLTDLYEITMAYSYFKQGRHNLPSVFDAFFRKAPFKGKFTVFAGLHDLIAFIRTFKFKEEQLTYLKTTFPHWTDDFFDYLRGLDGSHIKLYSIEEGSLVFPKAPVVQLEGPLGFLQIIETTVLNLLNFPTLMATNARRMRLATEEDKTLIEFGLRRAQGPDGAMMASEYSYLGGFHGTSNVAAGKAFGIKIYGTMAHAYICSYSSLSEVKGILNGQDLKAAAVQIRKEMDFDHTNEGELAAFIAYACDHPNGFLALVDTYNTLYSGVPNFIAVAVALKRMGIEARGIRLDSGDLSQLSKDARKFMDDQAKKFDVDFSKLAIFASNDLNEAALLEFKEKGHAMTAYGIGTNLVTCQAQPALGMVYKLVEINNTQKLKFSEDVDKISIPGKKKLYRLYSKNHNYPIADVLAKPDEKIEAGKEVYLRDFADKAVRYIIRPERVESILELFWDGKDAKKIYNLHEARDNCERQVKNFNPKVLDLKKPIDYKVYITQELYVDTDKVMEEHNIWREVREI